VAHAPSCDSSYFRAQDPGILLIASHFRGMHPEFG
jgi:hypothetical protein